ncbi:DUF805 domain-containing protein [uncultured Algimonas sp.]|uniref:DUF805 domain-containing protein n=1 Tax=uncultured Algimonas sp. TaxID=1547920 RepID=UPI002619E1DB|nr:DUF805 domain-containing protein [uncultured Algimonas sp.]
MTPPNVAIYDWIRKGLDFKGRSSRSDYWWPRLLVVTVNLVLMFLFFTGLGAEKSQILLEWLTAGTRSLEDLDIGPLPSLSLFALIFAIVFGVLTFIPDLSVSWRRFHDMDKPGWFHLVFFGLSGFIMLAPIVEYVWLSFPGTAGDNRYGSDPRSLWDDPGP